jgi:hypothetical protein
VCRPLQVLLAGGCDDTARGATATKALRDPATLLAAVLAAASLVQSWDLGRRSPGIDFYQFWVIAQLIGRADVPSIYSEEAHPRLGAEFIRRSLTEDDSERRRAAARAWQVLEPTATPMLYSAFRPIAGLRYDDAHLVFRILSLTALTVAVLALALLLGHSAAVGLLMLALLNVAFRPLKTDVQVGNINEVQLAVVAAYLWLSSRRDTDRLQAVAGALLGALVMFKPNLVAVLPVLGMTWLVKGRRRKLVLQAVGVAAGVLVSLAVTAAVFGSLEPWREWFEFMRAFPPAKIPLRYGNVGLARLVYETMDLHLTPWLAILFIVVALACVWMGRARGPVAAADDPRRAAAEDAAALGAGCFVYLLSSPLVWIHYLLLALPAALLLLRDPDDGTPADRARVPLTALALVAIAVDPVADLFQMYDMYQQAALTVAGVLTLFVLTLREVARPRP